MVKTLSGHSEINHDAAQLDACREIIARHCYSTQDEIRRELAHFGFPDISQSTVSRLLRRLGVAKAQNASGKKIYTLVEEQLEHGDSTRSIHDMVKSVESNHQLVLIHTTPGAATVVARMLDRHADPEIMGAVAGNDVVLVAPRHISRTKQTKDAVIRTLKKAH
ncbi:arginine repressor [Aeromonas diversa]|uniref:Arginine repressor n=1 Tax=Aeromonas diversa CDC 2478-85 TaxID=1268237 RepID=N9U020_9GAMM|nr:arginine repressor [Aeromonas diversa]ENY71650.1 arginine repressor [Aeromonas diversa CDC 2478-85]